MSRNLLVLLCTVPLVCGAQEARNSSPIARNRLFQDCWKVSQDIPKAIDMLNKAVAEKTDVADVIQQFEEWRKAARSVFDMAVPGVTVALLKKVGSEYKDLSDVIGVLEDWRERLGQGKPAFLATSAWPGLFPCPCGRKPAVAHRRFWQRGRPFQYLYLSP